MSAIDRRACDDETNITVSERAARRIGEILKAEGDGAMLRISVEGGGCSGFQYNSTSSGPRPTMIW